jgi:hypothetical protein
MPSPTSFQPRHRYGADAVAADIQINGCMGALILVFLERHVSVYAANCMGATISHPNLAGGRERGKAC